jgi:FlaG/FlaF family flagellin (archaellin)
MDTGEYLSSQNLMILISVVLIAVVALFLFKRKPSNQHPMEKSPDGAIATVKTDNDGR